MKKLFLISTAGLLLAACGDDQANEETPVTPEENTNEETGTETETGGEAGNEEMADNEENTEENNDTQNLITVELEFDIDDDIYDVNEDEWEQRFEVEEGTTLLELMQENYEIKEEGGIITSIEGYAQDESRNALWRFEVNDEQSPMGVDEYELQQGDEIEWELDD